MLQLAKQFFGLATIVSASLAHAQWTPISDNHANWVSIGSSSVNTEYFIDTKGTTSRGVIASFTSIKVLANNAKPVPVNGVPGATQSSVVVDLQYQCPNTRSALVFSRYLYPQQFSKGRMIRTTGANLFALSQGLEGSATDVIGKIACGELNIAQAKIKVQQRDTLAVQFKGNGPALREFFQACRSLITSRPTDSVLYMTSIEYAAPIKGASLGQHLAPAGVYTPTKMNYRSYSGNFVFDTFALLKDPFGNWTCQRY